MQWKEGRKISPNSLGEGSDSDTPVEVLADAAEDDKKYSQAHCTADCYRYGNLGDGGTCTDFGSHVRHALQDPRTQTLS